MNNFVPGRRRTILSESQTPLMDLLMSSRSAVEADQVLRIGKPRNGGGPLQFSSNESTYNGAGFLVDLLGRRFESPASVGGAATGLFT